MIIACSHLATLLQISAERLDQDAIQYKESPGTIVQATKNIGSMWVQMAQLIRFDIDCTKIIIKGIFSFEQIDTITKTTGRFGPWAFLSLVL
jgi:hypothetical protein